MKKILITGSNGQLGKGLNEFYKDVPDISIINTDIDKLDITSEQEVEEFIKRIRPDIIINCAAHTAVDACETDQKRAYNINALGPKNLSIAANIVDAVLVHISSDYVFDGLKDKPYIEGDLYAPQSVYGKTKLEGEKFVQEIAKKYFVVRTAWLYGEGKNFINTMLKLSDTRKKIRVVSDQWGTPTSVDEVVKVIDLLCKSDKYGIYHATCEGSCSWYEFAKTIFEEIGKDIEIIPVTTEEYGAVAPRPKYSILENRKLKVLFQYEMAEWKQALRIYLKKRGLLENMKEMNNTQTVLITGANGYIGRHVVKAVLDMGYKVLASDFSFEGVDERAVKIDTPIFSGDNDIYNKLGRPDVCVHLAWRNGFVHNDSSHIEDLPNHYIFLKNMIEGGLPQLSVMGTMHEVGYWEGAITENTPTNPISLYGIAKNTLRQAVLLLAQNNNTIVDWLRAYYILGDDSKSNSIFAKIVKWEEEGKETFPFNSGKNKYDFINVDELAYQIAKASTQTVVQGIINCCTEKPVSLAEKVEEFIKEHHFKIRPEYGAFPDRPYDSPGVWGDATKINKIMSK